MSALPPPILWDTGNSKPQANKAGGWVLAGGAVAVIIGAFMPWISVVTAFGSISRSGLDYEDGFLTVGIAIFVGVLAALTISEHVVSRWVALLGLLGATAGVILLFYDRSELANRIDLVNGNPLASAQIGSGLWMSLAGMVTAVVGSIMVMSRS